MDNDMNNPAPDPAPVPDPKPPRRFARATTWVLLGSVLVNAVLIGFVVGNMGRGGMRFMPQAMMDRDDRRDDRREERREERRDRDDDRRERQAGEQSARDTLRAAFEAERPALDKALGDLSAARAKAAGLIRAEPMDAAALDAAMAEMRLHSDAALASFHRSIAASAGKLEPRQRGALARMLERAPQGRQRPMGALGPPGAPREMLREFGPPPPLPPPPGQ